MQMQKKQNKKGLNWLKVYTDKLMTLPDRVSSLFAAETDQSVIGKTLKDRNCISYKFKY